MASNTTRFGILVAVDGSPAAKAAVCWAARDAALRGTALTIAHIVTVDTATWPPMPYAETFMDWQQDEARRVLVDAVKTAEEAMATGHHVPIVTELVLSSPIAALQEMSRAADLVVVGSSGHGVLARAVLGSVSSSLVRHAHCSVAVIRDEDPLMEQQPQHAPILVGVDGSAASDAATALAFDEASRRGVELVALHAWSDVSIISFPGLNWTEVSEEAERVLAERLAGWQETYPDVVVRRLVVQDRPSVAMIEAAESAQLIVVGTHGRGGVAGFLLGSVSNAVVHGVRMPVIVARSGHQH